MTARQRLAALLAHLPKTRCARLRAELDEVRAELDALDRGVVDNGLAIHKASLQINAAFKAITLTPQQAAELIERARAGDTLEAPRPAGLPKNHPESLVTELNPADEDELAELCTELWPNDEYLGITADGPGAP